MSALKDLLFLVLLVLFISCGQYSFDSIDRTEIPPIPKQSGSLVTAKMVGDYLGNPEQFTKSAEKNYSLSAYTDKYSDTLFYIVNYDNKQGWKILSSDVRTPPILAEGESGSFVLDENPSVRLWMEGVAMDMAAVRQSKDSELSFSSEEIALNRSLWTKEPIRSPGDTIVDYSGHWEYTVISSRLDTCSIVNHLVPQWDQSEPYNEYCPYQLFNSSERCAAGCVAIAGSQILYYLHDYLGVPSEMYSVGSCNGNPLSPGQTFSNPTDSVWLDMSFIYQNVAYSGLPEAIMIGYVGKTVEMNYGEQSWTLPSNLRTKLFNPLGIQCSHGDYNENIVKSSLADNLPVIVTASDLLIPGDFDIHTFVIDGYMTTRTIYTCRFYWVQDEFPPIGEGGENGEMPCPGSMHLPYTDYIYSSPTVSLIKINWGWWSQWVYPFVNEGWYSLTGGWTVTCGGETYDYNHNRKMIYGFHVEE